MNHVPHFQDYADVVCGGKLTVTLGFSDSG
jgi:hypothetical protein